jgi:predicted nucleic acid-binding protein
VIVLDASAVLELILSTTAGRQVADRIASPAESLHAPHLIDVEVAQALRRYARTGQLDAVRAGEALEDLADLDIRRYAHDLLLPRIWELRANATAYDAAYLALAEILRAPLLTRDTALAAVPGVRARVEVL